MNGSDPSDNAAPPDRSRQGAVVTEVEIINKKGLHARASARFVQTAERFDAAVTVTRGNESVGGTSIMGLMMLAAGTGTIITIEAVGPDAQAAVDALTALVSGGFGEED
jgi:phosphocarrier protein HPr